MATSPPVPDKPTAAARFKRRFRGYDSGAVDTFVRHLCRQLEEATAENDRQTTQITELSSRVEYFEGRGQALQDAMVTAESLRQQVLEAANDDSERIRQEASERAQRILDEANVEAVRIRAEADEVRDEVQRLKEESADEVEAIEQGALQHAESLAADIEREARANAERLLEEAQHQTEELTAQVEKLEQRKAEFVAFLARELAGDGELSGHPDSMEIGPLDVRFRGGAEPAGRSSA